MTSPRPGWYPDPSGGRFARWWDGTRWTDRVAPPTRWLPNELIPSRQDARLLITCMAVLFGGVTVLIVGHLIHTGDVRAAGIVVAMIGVLALNGLILDVSRRLWPHRLGVVRRWLVDRQVAQQLLRPAAVRASHRRSSEALVGAALAHRA